MKWLTVSLIKSHSRIEYDCEDELLELYGEAAEETILNICSRTFEELKAMGTGDKMPGSCWWITPTSSAVRYLHSTWHRYPTPLTHSSNPT